MKLFLALGVLGIAAALPGVASAHVGKTLPVATDFTARITGGVSGLSARVVDGDQSLWLRASAKAVVAIPGTLGEPLLRFDARGVWLNLRSPTAQSDRIDRTELRATASGRPPLWHRVTSGHAYLWHEHRVHALEPVARTAGSAGPWAVPLVVDGRRRTLRGVLDYTAPGATWAWIAAAVVLAAAAGAAALRSRVLLPPLAFAATAAVWALRLGRELYGRPGVPVVGWIEIALTCAIGIAFLVGLAACEHARLHRVLRRFRRGVPGAHDAAALHACSCAERTSEPGRSCSRGHRRRDRNRGARRQHRPAGGRGARVNVKLLAAVVALTAGAVAVFLVIALLHATPGPQ